LIGEHGQGFLQSRTCSYSDIESLD